MEENEQEDQKYPIYDEVDDTLDISGDGSPFAANAGGRPVSGKPKRNQST